MIKLLMIRKMVKIKKMKVKGDEDDEDKEDWDDEESLNITFTREIKPDY